MPKLPDAVQAQLDEADRIVQEAGDPAPEPVAPPTPAPEPEPAPAPAPEPAPAAEPPTDDDKSWRQKYLTLQGVQRADNARLTGEINELKVMVEGLKAQLEAKPAPEPPPAPAPKLVTDADIEAFGPDMIDVIQRAAKQLVDAEVAPIKAENVQLKSQLADLTGTVTSVADTQKTSGATVYYEELAKAVPDFKTINTDPAFLGWLAETDEMSGLLRQTLLNAAFKDMDPVRTATIFNRYKTATGITTASPPPPPPPAPPLSIEPKGSNALPPPEQPGAKIWSVDEIDAHYQKVARGEFRGREAEAERIEKEIDRSLQAT